MDAAYVRKVSNKLKSIAHDRGVAFLHIENQFLIECALARIVRHPNLSRHLVFKGGYVALRTYQSPRYTVDLDAIVRGISSEQVLDLIVTSILVEHTDPVWFTFEGKGELKTQNEYGGTRLVFRGGLGQKPDDIRKARIVNIDIGTGDPVTPEPRLENLPLTVGEGEISWLVYPVETIVAEKLHPLVKLGDLNSRSKDIFDLHLLLPRTNPAILRSALARTFEYRGDQLPQNIHAVVSVIDTALLQRGWRSAVSSVNPSPSFEDAFEKILAWLKLHQI